MERTRDDRRPADRTQEVERRMEGVGGRKIRQGYCQGEDMLKGWKCGIHVNEAQRVCAHIGEYSGVYYTC
ncbi:hypothetical protein P691DRAFT_809196 [Macrolepiota fuliginosa MF-IS2]|uniref:Uncharacterized protein n=1 Tax=Macrolepiota fuliginosa MF-IS2 TaxID=1400762 RepID=A0A9P5X4M1_9AGAR|nr:hypothetical protein P691DRAFT_809196 [Macrolepiota fuliginosa MF-IS2]